MRKVTDDIFGAELQNVKKIKKFKNKADTGCPGGTVG